MAKNQFKPHKLTMNHLDEDQIYSNILRNKGNSKDGCLCSRLIQSNLAISDYIISGMLRMKIKSFGLWVSNLLMRKEETEEINVRILQSMDYEA